VIYRLPDGELERFIDEDVPYGDLTTLLVGIGRQPGEIIFTTRDETTICCTEEAARILEKCGAAVTTCSPSGASLSPGTEFLSAEGPAQALHAGWKVALNILEYASGIATRTHRIVTKANQVNPNIVVVTTRKSFPGTKKLAIKAITAGGAFPHRLGLSETILIFKHHTVFLGGLDAFLQTVGHLSLQAPEKRIMVEAENAKEALRIVQAGVDIVQVDKMSPAELSLLIREIRRIAPTAKVSAAGGINEANVAAFAATGVDILVLSSVYFGKPADIAVRITSKINTPG
jgi:molybdenum transport protein